MKIDIAGEITFIANTPKDKKKVIDLVKFFTLAEKAKYTTIKWTNRITEDGSFECKIKGIESD